jgi:hypothetical protein
MGDFDFGQAFQSFIVSQIQGGVEGEITIPFPVGPLIGEVSLVVSIEGTTCCDSEDVNWSCTTTTIEIDGNVGIGRTLKKFPEPKSRHRNRGVPHPNKAGQTIKEKHRTGMNRPMRDQIHTSGFAIGLGAGVSNSACPPDQGWSPAVFSIYIAGEVGIIAGTRGEASISWEWGTNLTWNNLVGKIEGHVGGGIVGAELSVGIKGTMEHVTCTTETGPTSKK